MEFIIHILIIIIVEAFDTQDISVMVTFKKMLIKHSYSPFEVIIIIIIMDIINHIIIIIKEYSFLDSFVKGYLRIVKPMVFVINLEIIILAIIITIIKVIMKVIKEILIDFILDFFAIAKFMVNADFMRINLKEFIIIIIIIKVKVKVKVMDHPYQTNQY